MQFKIGARVRMNPDSRFAKQCIANGVEHLGTIVARSGMGNFDWKVLWDFEKRAHQHYNESDLILTEPTNNAFLYLLKKTKF